MLHPDSLHIHAYVNGELDALAAAQIEQHLQACSACQTQLQELQQIRADLRRLLTDYRAPEALRAKMDQLLEREAAALSADHAALADDHTARAARRTPDRRRLLQWLRPGRQFWLGGLSGGALVTAAAACWGLLLGVPGAEPLGEELVAAHVRALISTHPIDVVSTDRHTVKPWFSGHADVSPVVADFEPQGFRLIGGRADYVQHQRAAVMVYQHGAHTIDVFSWAAGSARLPSDLTRDGYHVACWRAQDLHYCAVSDTGWNELSDLQHLLQQQSAQDHP